MHDNHQTIARHHVLYVDDDPALLEIGRLFLENDRTFTVDTVTSAHEAIHHLKSISYDAIVSDYQMPEMDGITFLKTLRAQGMTTPFIIFTGKGREEVVIEALNCGADFYLQKGGDPTSQFAELAHKIRHAVSEKRADQALKKSEYDYRHLIEHANEAIYVVQDGLLRMANPRTIELSGYSEEELLNQPFTRFVHPDDREMLLDRFKKRIDGETIPSRYSFRLYRKEGEVWWAELSAVAIIWDGRPATLNFIIDITERKLAENALRESEERYRIVTQSITDIVWDWDISAGSLQWFGDIDTLLGYAPGAFPRTIEAWEGIIHADDRDRVIHALDRSRHTGEPFDEEYRVLTRDGTDRYWCDRAHAIHDDRGTVVRIIGAITDATERRKTEERLRESDERYRQFFRTTLDSVFITSPEGRYIDFNDRLMERLGCKSREEAFGIDIASTYAHPEERAGFIALVERDGYIKERPIQFRKRDGTILNTLITIVPMKNPDGSVKAFIGTIRDATEREQAEKVLRQSEAKFHSLYEHMIEGAALHELTYNDQGVPVDYVFIQTNPAFGRQLGISEDNVIGKTSREVYGVAEPPYLDIYARVALTGEPEVFETWFPSLAKHFSISAYRPYKGSFATIFEDITERKRAEEALRGSEAQLRTLIDTLPDLVWLKDPEGIYLSCNRRFGNFFGAAERDIVGKTDYDFMEKDQGDFFRHHDKAALAAGGPTANEEEITFANDGHREVLETIKTPVRASDGRLIGVLGISRNITGRKQADEALRQANRKLTLLSGITRHDINNQLTVLKGYLTLVENMQPDTLSGEYFRKINAAVQRISAMIQFMKDYEKIGVTAPEWQDTHALVDAVVKQTSLGQITVKNDLPSGTEVFADPLIAKVIYNLTDNAVRHGGKIMTIRFFVKENNENRILVCEDDGEGIPAGEKEKIFERGFGKNSGLGLALSREILSITGITIVETGVPGKGARFEMAVPGGCYRQGGGKNH